MWQLSQDNAAVWLRRVGLGNAARVETLSGGVSGVVLRVELNGRWIVLKQACAQLRTREAWFSDPARIFREREVMDLLHPLLPAGAIPRVVHMDRECGVLAMEHAPEGATPWKARLLAGELDPEVAGRAGRLLGTIHRVTGERRAGLSRMRERTVFVQLRVDPFHRKIQERHPDLAPLIEPLVAEMSTRNDALCHGDFSPKNLLASESVLTLVDHETAHLGDPAMDVGFFFSHLVLKAMRSLERWDGWRGLIEAGYRGWWDETTHATRAETARRGLSHLAVCLLARIDGTSPVDYLPDEATREAVRRLGRSLLREPVETWDAALDRVRDR